MRELGLEEGNDTLGRWMAHHLAELMHKSEHGATTAERVSAGKSATETILNIWERRASLPGQAYPLAPYKDVLQVLDRLPPGKNPFRFMSRYGETNREQRTIALFDDLSRLIIALLLMEIAPKEEFTKVDTAARGALSDTEHHVLTVLQQWGELFESIPQSAGRTGKDKKQSGAKVNLNKAALRLIDSLTTTLGELRSEL